MPPLEARILLGHVLGWRRTELITRSDEPLDAALVARYQALEARRLAGEPVAQLVGAREFFGLDFEVTPDVLIPRPETELLVETVLAALEGMARPRVLDLGTGTGAIAIAIASARPDAQVWAVDRWPKRLPSRPATPHDCWTRLATAARCGWRAVTGTTRSILPCALT